MMFSCDFRSMASIRAWDAAATHFRKIPPHKKWDQQHRPLNGHTKQHVALVKLPGDAYACRLYKLDMVTYYPDGKVGVRLDSRMSSKRFLANTLPWGMCVGPGDTLKVNGYVNDLAGEHYLADAGLMLFAPDTDQMLPWKLIGQPATRTKYQVNRSKSKEIRIKLEPFMTFVEGRNKLCPSQVRYGANSLSAETFISLMGDKLDTWVKAAPYYISRKAFLASAYKKLGCLDMMLVSTTTPP